ncbi:hypothetical protein CFIMG_007904RA00001 [Ceratocystis fimbriata CBS 114723]|uniref:Extracellular serine-rich protein n=1 Tax=Ceratocystis fimbriata CBS 114723 TaxID=1035309 RepID=A0A2C5WSY0_9PEZI|nr:hypothetical protein CFIMG_007904RA00001 [Ceratocystis fimbriata CBS 114723]
MRPTIVALLAATAIMASPTKTSGDSPSKVAKRGATHTVQVGEIIYPEEINADVGDEIEFQFESGTHSVVESSFGTPCSSNGGFASGAIKNEEWEDIKTGYLIEVTQDGPMWFYNGVGGRCHRKGTVGVINRPKSGGQTLFQYYEAAMKESSTENPAQNGGDLINF